MSRKLEQLAFDNSFGRLPPAFYSRLMPTPFEYPPYLISFNRDVAELIGLDPEEVQRPEFLAYLTGEKPWPGSDPLAMLYAGHQFGHYVPQLGDGRAILLGEVRNVQGDKWDLQLKGCGITPYSRQGDGRAVLRSTIREYLCSEAMHGLGIPTTRALCIIGSEEEVYREEIESGAMLLRVAPSHVRFGSFEVFYYRGQHDQIRVLADYVIEQHYPELAAHPQKYVEWLRQIVSRTARLIAQWQTVGFAHGVMNTDNMSILGLTLDYGPYGFLEQFDPGFICNHSDHHGRYAFDQQPHVALWNLACLAQALTPLMSVDEAKGALAEYESTFITHYYDLMRQKLGLPELNEQAVSVVDALLELVREDSRDYTLTLRALAQFRSGREANNHLLRDHFIQRAKFDRWAHAYNTILLQYHSNDAERAQQMNACNPKYILRNYLAQIAIRKAQDEKDYSEIDRLLLALRNPFAEQPEFEPYAAEPPDWAKTISVSCSS
ncbi:MAG: YdiU family protein [Gammaproteobacteria bacterium]|nr:YdiU family protein [Gammaproteobacteria bacterium]